MIKSLPQGGIALFNLSGKYTAELRKLAGNLPTKLRIYSYALRSDNPLSADLVSKVITVDENGIKFKVNVFGEQRIFVTKVPGIHFIENISGAILLARILNVGWDQIEQGLKTLSMPEKTMEVRKSDTGIILIDDTHNSTPKAFHAALMYISYFKKKKLVVTSGIIELGKESFKHHKLIGKMMRNTIDKIILTNKDFERGLKEGLGSASDKLIVSNSVNNLRKELGPLRKKYSIILLEGRIPKDIYDMIMAEK